MVIFDNTAFKLNENLTYETIDTPLAKITIIEDFYADFDGVLEEIEKLPVVTTVYDSHDVFDGRRTYAPNMGSTTLPYSDKLPSLVGEIIEYDGEVVDIERNLLINCNIVKTDKVQDYYYNVHHDSGNSYSAGTSYDIAVVVFLNKEYGDGDGFNTYIEPDNYHTQLWHSKDALDLNYFVPGKANRAVLFSCNMLHGSSMESDLFKTQCRHTQVIFFTLR